MISHLDPLKLYWNLGWVPIFCGDLPNEQFNTQLSSEKRIRLLFLSSPLFNSRPISSLNCVSHCSENGIHTNARDDIPSCIPTPPSTSSPPTATHGTENSLATCSASHSSFSHHNNIQLPKVPVPTTIANNQNLLKLLAPEGEPSLPTLRFKMLPPLTLVGLWRKRN